MEGHTLSAGYVCTKTDDVAVEEWLGNVLDDFKLVDEGAMHGAVVLDMDKRCLRGSGQPCPTKW